MSETSRLLNPTVPGGLLTQIQGILTAGEALVVQSIASGQYFHINEVPAGDVDGVNQVFFLQTSPNPDSSLEVYVNGQKFKDVEDYNIMDDELIFVIPPEIDSLILVNYTVSPV